MYLSEKCNCLIGEMGDIKRLLQSSTHNPVGIFNSTLMNDGQSHRCDLRWRLNLYDFVTVIANDNQ